MGSAGKQRGKKAWRSIDASAVEDSFANAAAAAKSGAHVGSLPDEALFFVDTQPREGAPAQLWAVSVVVRAGG